MLKWGVCVSKCPTASDLEAGDWFKKEANCLDNGKLDQYENYACTQAVTSSRPAKYPTVPFGNVCYPDQDWLDNPPEGASVPT